MFEPTDSSSSAAGGTGKNYLGTVNSVNGNGDFELGTTSMWSLGTVTLTNALPTGAPTFGSGASGNLSISAVTSGKLAGVYSLSYASSAATTAGDFVASDAFTIDTEDQAKVMTFSFYYSPTVGASTASWAGTSANSFGVAIYDVTASAWIIPAGVFGMTQSSGVGICTGTFQTTSSSTSYRIVVYNANATSGAVTVLFDDFFLGPQTSPIGAIATDWVNFTPTGSWSTNTTYNGYWRRVGDSAEVLTYITVSGAPTSAGLTINLPSGLSINTTKTISTRSQVAAIGYGTVRDTGTARYDVVVQYDTATSVIVCAKGQGGTYIDSTTAVTQAIPMTFASTDEVIIRYFVPIQGWSSSVQMSNSTDTRVVAAIITGDPASATVGNPIIVPTVGLDTHGGYNATTGRYTVPISGVYKVYGALLSASSATTLTIYKNAVSTSLAGSLDSNGEATYGSAVNCVAGDIIDIRPGGTVDATSMTLNIERLSGPSVAAATDSVNARYFASATAISGSLATIVWTTKDFDTHNAMASGLYTVPVSGKYHVSAALALAGTFILNNTTVIEIQKNSVAVSNLTRYIAAAITNDGIDIEDTISCVAGDVIRIQVSNAGTTPTIVSSNTRNFISLFRVGN